MHHTATNHLSSPSGESSKIVPTLWRELLAAVLAPQQVPAGNLADPIRSACRADDPAARPLDPPHVGVTHREVGEVADGFHQGFGCVDHWSSSKAARPAVYPWPVTGRPPGGRGVRLAPVVAFLLPTADVLQFGLNIAAGLGVEFLGPSRPSSCERIGVGPDLDRSPNGQPVA